MKYLNKEFFINVKRRLKVIKKSSITKISALSLAVVLLVSGCGVKESTPQQSVNNSSNSYTQYDESNTHNSSNTTTTPSPSKPIEIKSDLTDAEMKLLEQQVSINNQDSQAFASYVHGISVDYEGSEYFEINQAFQRYQSIQEYETVSSNFIQNGKINELALKQQVIDNNKTYLENTQSKKYTQLDASTFNKVFSNLVDALNYNLSNTSDIDINQLDDNLTNLRIFRMTTPGSGATTDDGIVAVNLEDISTRQQRYPNVDYLRMTVLHEGNHLVQVSSVKEREQEGYSRNLGIAYSWEDLKINSLFYKWYVESSAEYLKNYQYGKDSLTTTYENHVQSLEMMTLATILKGNVDDTTLAKISLQSDLNKLFEIFNCQNNQDKIEVLNMMYAMEICLNQPTEFSKLYKESTGESLNTYKYQDSLESSIGQTLSKKFYENLASYTTGSNHSLKEIFSIISTFELEMSRLTWFSSDSCTDTNESFIKAYTDIQNYYFNLLAKSLGMSLEDLKGLYNSYYHDEISQVNYANLGESQDKFLSSIIQSRENSRKNTVGEISTFKTK